MDNCLEVKKPCYEWLRSAGDRESGVGFSAKKPRRMQHSMARLMSGATTVYPQSRGSCQWLFMCSYLCVKFVVSRVSCHVMSLNTAGNGIV